MKRVEIRIIKAILTRITDISTLMLEDPYVQLKIGDQTFRTKTIANGGDMPQWNQSFSCSIANNSLLQITVLDKDKNSADDLIGQCEIQINTQANTHIHDQFSKQNWYSIKVHKNTHAHNNKNKKYNAGVDNQFQYKPAGKIMIQIRVDEFRLGYDDNKQKIMRLSNSVQNIKQNGKLVNNNYSSAITYSLDKSFTSTRRQPIKLNNSVSRLQRKKYTSSGKKLQQNDISKTLYQNKIALYFKVNNLNQWRINRTTIDDSRRNIIVEKPIGLSIKQRFK